MAVRNPKLIPVLWGVAGVAFLVPVVINLIEGEPVRWALAALAFMCFTFGAVFLAAGNAARRKSGIGSGPPSA